MTIRPSLRRILTISGFSLAAAALLAGCAAAVGGRKTRGYLVYVGTNVASATDNTIYLYRLDPATGALTPVSAQPGGPSPTYLALTPDHRRLYAVNETGNFQGQSSGSLRAFSVNQQTGALTLLNEQPSTGASPCYVSLDRTGKAVLVANYTGGNVALLPVGADGQLVAPTATDQHEGRGPHPNQDRAHAHCIVPDPANAYAFSVDLGTDQVTAYRLQPAQGQLARQPEPAFQAKPGAGPRHLTFAPGGKRAYLINELNSTLTALDYDAAAGRFRELQTVPTLPGSYTGTNSCADVHVSPDGRFLYASNRGHNSIAVFALDAASGQMSLVQHISTEGQTPRNFTLDPTGRLLLVANQNSNNIVTFRVDQATGQLTSTGQTVTLPSPMFVQVAEDFTR
ncbi:lactonase family protein [uncultured Hymenobacter sp.]|uniref:lactonase family protein n=1 Tax=uncultured Hymenobacter sp. TaxID=170016 RepID=UPI0035CBB7CB